MQLSTRGCPIFYLMAMLPFSVRAIKCSIEHFYSLVSDSPGAMKLNNISKSSSLIVTCPSSSRMLSISLRVGIIKEASSSPFLTYENKLLRSLLLDLICDMIFSKAKLSFYSSPI